MSLVNVCMLVLCLLHCYMRIFTYFLFVFLVFLLFFFIMILPLHCFFFFFFNDTATTEIYTLSLHDALPISFSREGQPGVRIDQPGIREPGVEAGKGAPVGGILAPGDLPYERRKQAVRLFRSDEGAVVKEPAAVLDLDPLGHSHPYSSSIDTTPLSAKSMPRW